MLSLRLARQVALRSAVCAVQVRAKTAKAAPKKVAKQAVKATATEEGAAAKAKAATQKARVTKIAATKAMVKARNARLATKQAAAKAAAQAQASMAVAQKKAARKAKIASSGPVSARNLFISKEAKGKGKVDLKSLSSQWAGLSAAKKSAYEAEAAKNLAKRQQIRQSLKVPANNYALFVKANFASAYAAALKQASDKKEAFRLATAAVAKKYKSQ